ncbi:MAG: hypothetical protein CMC08_02810 [Flavobacteriaceae bacterium]|nr:hypothetical protein [Flavobacteriaceae bacterium]
MKHRLLALVFFAALTATAQHPLERYGYVTLSENFDFLNEADQYQLNSLTKYLLNQNGLNAYFDSEVPDFRRCDGLRTIVEGKPGFIYTKITIVFKDCNDMEVYRSEEGRSKYKNFRRAYHDALRNAFVSIENLGIQQQPVASLSQSEAPNTVRSEKLPIQTKIVGDGQVAVATDSQLPTSKFSSYTYNGQAYLLRKTAAGYSLYREDALAADGLLLTGTLFAGDASIRFQDSEGNKFDVIFDASENFTIRRPIGDERYLRVR